MHRSIQNINVPLPLPGMPRAFECFLCPGSWEFDLKGHPRSGDLTLPGWGREFEFKKIFFWPAPIKRMWLFQNVEQFKGKDIAFVNNWLTEKGLTKLCCVFKGMFEQLNTLNIASIAVQCVLL